MIPILLLLLLLIRLFLLLSLILVLFRPHPHPVALAILARPFLIRSARCPSSTVGSTTACWGMAPRT
eukprot:4302898-Pyramimonas_sp.AAC.1